MTRSYNLAQRLFVDDDGTVCPITNMYAADGDETDRPDLAVAIVAKRSDGEWLTVRVNEDDDEPHEYLG